MATFFLCKNQSILLF